jgi:hypothetical protein
MATIFLVLSMQDTDWFEVASLVEGPSTIDTILMQTPHAVADFRSLDCERHSGVTPGISVVRMRRCITRPTTWPFVVLCRQS